MLKIYTITLSILLVLLLNKYIFLKIKSKKSRELYDGIIAQRGFHMIYPENSLEAFNAALDANFMGIECDVRYLNDGNIICFNDKYTKRLLQIPGKVYDFSFSTIKNFGLEGTNYKVPSLKETLNLISGRCILLIDVKGKLSKKYLYNIVRLVDDYPYRDTLYFHTNKIKNYKKLKRVYGEKVFYTFNPIRRPFNFIKGTDYKVYKNKYDELANEIDIEIPSPEDIGQIITKHLQTKIEDKNEILTSIGTIINRYETRVGESSWVTNSLWLHRGIISNRYLEHSREAFYACIEYAKKNNMNVTVEFDVMLFKDEVRCYHKDRISSILGQEKSCAEKQKLDNSLSLSEILNIFAGSEEYINLAIDIKDYHFNKETLPKLILECIDNSNFNGNIILMSYNPFILNYFKNSRGEFLRAQIGHSLSGLRKVPFFRFPWILNGILGILFDVGHADVTLFDNSEWIFWMISYHKNIMGKPVLIYAPKSYIEVEGFIGKESIANFIIENAENTDSWPEQYLNKFKM